jgi:hypothetical protein
MSEKTLELIQKMLSLIPSSESAYMKSSQDNGQILETVIIEDVFMPEIIILLQEDANIDMIKRLFDYFEEIVISGDQYLLNVLSVNVLEIFGNDRSILGTARKYMGPRIMKLQEQADMNLGRIPFEESSISN